jgi:hypothetical protein
VFISERHLSSYKPVLCAWIRSNPISKMVSLYPKCVGPRATYYQVTLQCPILDVRGELISHFECDITWKSLCDVNLRWRFKKKGSFHDWIQFFKDCSRTQISGRHILSYKQVWWNLVRSNPNSKKKLSAAFLQFTSLLAH